MQKLRFTIISIVCVLGLLSATTSCGKEKGAGIREVENNSQALKQAPNECLVTFHEFFRYIQKPEPSIVTDKQAQTRWLSEDLRKALAHNLKRFENQTDAPDYPTNSAFIGVWDRPTTYSVVGSRHYDHRDGKNPNDNYVIIDVLYEWSASDNDTNYPGQKSLMSFIFVNEEGPWKLDDIYTFRDEYARAGSLSSYWWRD